jgi:hypothetical protein
MKMIVSVERMEPGGAERLQREPGRARASMTGLIKKWEKALFFPFD